MLEREISTIIDNKDAGIKIRKFESSDVLDLDKKLSNLQNSLKNNLANVNEAEINIPEFVLVEPLSNQQRKIVDEILGPYFAQRSVSQQEIIANVPIKESFEKMVFLPSILEGSGLPFSLSELPFNEACGDFANKTRVFWVRQSMGERLVALAKALSNIDVYMHLEDAFRPVGVQEGLFKRRVDWITKEHPDWDLNSVMTEAKSKTAVTARLASHKSGAALDTTFRSTATDKPLDLGNKYPEGGAIVAIDCPFVTAEQWRTRQLFANAFGMSGFGIYLGEDWHAAFMDNLSGVKNDKIINGYVAKYGPIKSFSMETGEILEIYNSNEYDKLFPKE